MAARRPGRARRPPQRLGWEDDYDTPRVVMNASSDDDDHDDESSDNGDLSDQSGQSEDTESEASGCENDDSESDDENDEGELDDWVRGDVPPNVPAFTPRTGPGLHLPPGTNPAAMEPCDFFLLFLGNFFAVLAQETNRYAQQYIANGNFPPHSRVHKWHDTNASEMMAFIALWFAMGIDDRPTYECYWSTDEIFNGQFWRSVMSRDRFLLLLRFFHLVNNEDHVNAPNDGRPRDKLYKIRPLIDILNENFEALYTPLKNLCVDETLVPWTGRLGFKQYIPIKPNKYGIKVYQLCESDSGYSLKFKVYQGKEGNQVDRNHTRNIVLELMEPYLDQGYLLWMDNYYTGVPLFEELRNRDTVAAGTVRLTRRGIPPVVRLKKLRKGEVIFRRKRDLLVLKWMDNSEVKFLTTAHTADMVNGRHTDNDGNPTQVPAIKPAYDQNMNGVDICDQNVSTYLPRRKSLKWYMKLAMYLLSQARFQAYVIYKKCTPPDVTVSQLQFTNDLVLSLVERANLPAVQLGRRPQFPVRRLLERHFPSHIPPTEHKEKPTRRCEVCSVPTGHRRQRGIRAPRRHESRYMCQDCGVALCVEPCFRLYHTHKDYRAAYVAQAGDEE